MTNSKNKNNGNGGSQNLTLCAVCQKTGGRGAQWLLFIEGHERPWRVHKPCGDNAAANAPEGTKVKVVPTHALRRQWQAERQGRNFWGKATQDISNSGKPQHWGESLGEAFEKAQNQKFRR